MKTKQIIKALQIPESAGVNRRVPKKMLVENGAPTAADKRRIEEGIQELNWAAALKPSTIGVPEYRDAERDYLEIAVLEVVLHPATKENRILELIHRAVPYPVFLVSRAADHCTVSLAHKRRSQGEGGKTVLDDAVTCVELPQDALSDSFLESLALPKQPRDHMLTLYRGWLQCAEAFLIAKITGNYVIPSGVDDAACRREAFKEYEKIMSQISSLRAQAAKESQMNRRVDLNLQIKDLEAALAIAKDRM